MREERKRFKTSVSPSSTLQGLGSQCPYYLDPSRNSVTGRGITDEGTIAHLLRLHNEVRSKIARGWCDQPKAGCMGPLVS